MALPYMSSGRSDVEAGNNAVALLPAILGIDVSPGMRGARVPEPFLRPFDLVGLWVYVPSGKADH